MKIITLRLRVTPKVAIHFIIRYRNQESPRIHGSVTSLVWSQYLQERETEAATEAGTSIKKSYRNQESPRIHGSTTSLVWRQYLQERETEAA